MLLFCQFFILFIFGVLHLERFDVRSWKSRLGYEDLCGCLERSISPRVFLHLLSVHLFSSSCHFCVFTSVSSSCFAPRVFLPLLIMRLVVLAFFPRALRVYSELCLSISLSYPSQLLLPAFGCQPLSFGFQLGYLVFHPPVFVYANF